MDGGRGGGEVREGGRGERETLSLFFLTSHQN